MTKPHKQKWALALGEDFNEGIWEHFHSVNFQSIIDSKLRSLQYKLLDWAIPTNKYLFQHKFKNSDLCYFCHETTESLEHLFWLCPKVKKFWDEVKCLFNQSHLPENFMTPKSVMLGYRGNNDRILNHMFNLLNIVFLQLNAQREH